VQVVNGGKPVPGLKVGLETDPEGDEDGRVLQTHSTDGKGWIHLERIKPGRYYVTIDHVAFPESKEIVVDHDGSKNLTTKLSFEWPPAKPLSVQFVSGLLNAEISTGNTLNDQVHPTSAPLGEAKLTLLQGVSGNVLESEVASESGAFSFRPTTPGLYVLHIELPEGAKGRYRTGDGYVPLEIDPSATAATLNLYLFPAVCSALGYENREEATGKCFDGPRQIPRVARDDVFPDRKHLSPVCGAA
jgi:hypothetical protein